MSFIKAIKIALIGVAIIAKPSHAQELNDISTEVILAKDVNPFAAFGRTVKYYLGPRTRSVTFTVNKDQSYQIDIGAAVEEAMNEWHQAMGINFEPASQNDAQLTVYISNGAIRPPDDPCGQADVLALTSSSGRDATHAYKASISYFQSVIQKAISDDSYKGKLKDKSDVDALKLMVRYLSKHEMGHVLGFIHPRSLHTQPVPECGYIFQSANVTWPYSSASIMTPEFIGYLNYLYASLYRPIAISDVEISPQERAAASRIGSNACWPTSRRAIYELDSSSNMKRCINNSQIYPILLLND